MLSTTFFPIVYKFVCVCVLHVCASAHLYMCVCELACDCTYTGLCIKSKRKCVVPGNISNSYLAYKTESNHDLHRIFKQNLLRFANKKKKTGHTPY